MTDEQAETARTPLRTGEQVSEIPPQFREMDADRLEAVLWRLVRCDRVINPRRWRLYDIADGEEPLFATIPEAAEAVTTDLPSIRLAQRWAHTHGYLRECWILADAMAGWIGQKRPLDLGLAMYNLGIEAARRAAAAVEAPEPADRSADALREALNAQAALHCRRALLHGWHGNPASAIADFLRARDLYDQTGHVMGRGTVAEGLAATYRSLPDPDLAAAEREAHLAHTAFSDAGATRGMFIAAGRLGVIQVDRGAVEEGLANLRIAVDGMDELGDVRHAARLRLVLAAGLITAAARPGEAQNELDAAEDAVRATGSWWHLARVFELRGNALHLTGESPEPAIQAWATAHQGYLDVGDIAAADRVCAAMCEPTEPDEQPGSGTATGPGGGPARDRFITPPA